MKTVLIFMLLFLIRTSIYSQQTISSGGIEAAGAGGNVSYTVGRVVYTTITGSNGSLDAAVQQPYEISVITGLEKARGIDLQWNAYPNPVHDYLTLSLTNSENTWLKPEILSYQLYDVSGRLIQQNPLDGYETIIQMGSYRQGIYILKVINNEGIASEKELKSFKIIKK